MRRSTRVGTEAQRSHGLIESPCCALRLFRIAQAPPETTSTPRSPVNLSGQPQQLRWVGWWWRGGWGMG